MIEGLGSPDRARESNEAAGTQELQFMILKSLRQQQRRSRPIQNEAESAERLLRASPRPDPTRAKDLVPHTLRPTADGLEWAFDSRASSVFVGASCDNDAKFWRNIQALCCLISGMLSHEYWCADMRNGTFDGRFAENEMQQRIDQFNDCEHHCSKTQATWFITTSLTVWRTFVWPFLPRSFR